MPIQKITNRKFIAEIADGFRLTSVVYTAKAKAASKVHQSPIEKLKAKSRVRCPCDNNNTIPLIQSKRPATRNGNIFSFKKMEARIIAITGEEVVPISARLIAVV